MHSNEDEMTEEERKAQTALGTLPTFDFRIVQPLTITLDIEMTNKVTATDRNAALKLHTEMMKEPEMVVPLARDRVDTYTSTYKMEDDHTFARAVVTALTNIKTAEAFIVDKKDRKPNSY